MVAGNGILENAGFRSSNAPLGNRAESQRNLSPSFNWMTERDDQRVLTRDLGAQEVSRLDWPRR